MGLESYCNRVAAALARKLKNLSEQGLMAQMHPVKIADCHSRSKKWSGDFFQAMVDFHFLPFDFLKSAQNSESE